MIIADIGKFPLRFCYINPCQFAVCPAFPDAKCRDCGCSPRWLLNGFDVTKNFYGKFISFTLILTTVGIEFPVDTPSQSYKINV